MGDFLASANAELDFINGLLRQHKNRQTQHKGVVFQTTSRNKHYYVKQIRRNGKVHRCYLGKADSEKVRLEKIQQMESALYDTLCLNKQILESAIQEYESYDLGSLENKVSACLAKVKCVFLIDRRLEKMFAWAKADYMRNSKPFPDQIILAKDGTRVRSKDECVWYNYLLDAGLPFRYDWVMEFEDPWNPGEKIYKSPDFVIMTPDCKLILIEHAGLLTKDSYAADIKDKIQIYLFNGYVLGDNFFIMSDDCFGGVNTYAIQRLVAEIKSRFFCF